MTGEDVTRRRLPIVLAVLLILFAAGCSDSPTKADPAAPPQSATVAPDVFPVELTHALGTARIPSAPQRVVALSFEQDVLATIGMRTVGHADNYIARGEQYPWQIGSVDPSGSQVVTSVPDGAVQIERVAALKPDLILATDFFKLPSVYQQLSAIAPTVGYASAWGESSWQETAAVVGRAVGQSQAIAQQIAKAEAAIAAMVARHPGLAGRTYAGVYNHAPKQFATNVDPKIIAARPLGRFGLVIKPELARAVVDRSLSMERIDALDADLLVVSFASPELRDQLTKDPLFTRLNAVREGRVLYLDAGAAFATNNPTILNVPWQLRLYEEVFTKVGALPRSTATPVSSPSA